MKSSYILLSAFLALIITNTYSVETTSVQTQEQAPVIAKDDSSFGNRQNKKYQLAVGFGIEYSIFAFTLSGGYFLSPSEVVTFSYARITDDYIIREQDRIPNFKYQLDILRSYAFGYKRFLGNSFNIQPTVYYRRSSTDFVTMGTIEGAGTPNLIYEDIGIGIRIGNEWQWDNFVIGFDWFGINKTIHKINSQITWQGTPHSLVFKKETTLTRGSSYLGYSF